MMTDDEAEPTSPRVNWTDRTLPVLVRYEAWKRKAYWNAREMPDETAVLMADLAAVLRTAIEHSAPWELRHAKKWQHEARDPDTGERLFPEAEEG